jgi:hypothetical protein
MHNLLSSYLTKSSLKSTGFHISVRFTAKNYLFQTIILISCQFCLLSELNHFKLDKEDHYQIKESSKSYPISWILKYFYGLRPTLHDFQTSLGQNLFYLQVEAADFHRTHHK